MTRPITALIVDDEQHVHVYLRILLKQLGVVTVWDAAEGHSALELAEEHKPDVVLLDMNLPQFSGMEVLKALKTAHPEMHVVVVWWRASRRPLFRPASWEPTDMCSNIIRGRRC